MHRSSSVLRGSPLGVLLLGSLAACGGGGGGGGTVLEGAVVTGHVEALGAPEIGLGEVTVHLGSQRTTTNEQGWYIFSDVGGTGPLVVRGEREGHVSAAETLEVVAGGAYHVDLVLAPVQGSQTLAAEAGGTVAAAGAELVVPPGAFVDEAGAAVTGEVEVSLAVVDPGASAQAGVAFPGEPVGRMTDGELSPLESFGIFAIEARQGGRLLQLATGRSLEARVPIAASGLATAPATIALWSFDESEGLWDEEGEATRNGDRYVASIPHLSWWNFDAPYLAQTTCVSVCFTGASGPLVGVHVEIEVPIVRSTRGGYTGSDGCVSVDVRAGSDATLRAAYNGDPPFTRSFVTQELITTTRARPPMCQDLGTIDLSPSVAQAILTWGPAPSDLDSHLTGPGATERFHVYYGNRGAASGEPYCVLDTDDTSAFGPEVITVHRAMSGTYRYAVHNFSGQSSHPLESSGAQVVLILPGLGQIVSFTPPSSNGSNGNVWRVFDLHAEGDRIVAYTALGEYAQTSSSTGPAFEP
jgi:hypothetical protein